MRARSAIQIMTFLLPWAVYGTAWSSDADGTTNPQPQNARIVSLEWAGEEERQLDIQSVASRQSGLEFQPMPAKRNLGFRKQPVWFHARLEFPENATGYLLELNYAQLDIVEAYWQESGAWVTHLAGDRLPFAVRTEKAPHPVFRLPQQSGQFDVYFRVQMSGSLQFPLTLTERDAYAAQQVNLQFFMGLYFAVIGTMMFYNLFLYTAMRDKTFLFLVSYLAGLMGFQGAFTGYAAMYFWPEAGEWPHLATLPFICLCVASGSLFVNTLTGDGKVVPSAAKILPALALLMIIPLILMPVDYSLALQVLILFVLISVLYYPWPIILALIRGYRPARFLVLGIFFILPGSLLLLGRYLNWLPVNFWTQHGFRMSTAAEAIIFSFAVADRINFLREERDLAQDKLLHNEQMALRTQRDYSRRLLMAQDTERKRLARELHDGFGQTLAAFPNMLKRWMRKDGAPLPEEFHQAAALAKGMMADVRSLSHNLHPHQLDKLGLKAALLSVAEHAESISGLKVDHDLEDLEGVLNDEEKLHIYRLAQEAMTNIQRHARATRAGMQLLRNDNNVVLRITDNGIGLPADINGQSLGLTSMQERARAMDARLEITGLAGNGTTIELILPVRTGT